jgi:hypothetical protein
MRTALIAALVIIATLTREASGLLICLMVFADTPRYWQRWIICGICFIAVFGGLRLLIDAPETIFTPQYVWHLNTQTYRLTGAIVYQPLFWLLTIAVGLRVNRRLMLVLVPYLGLVAVFGVWREVRLLMPLWLLALPLLPNNNDNE